MNVEQLEVDEILAGAERAFEKSFERQDKNLASQDLLSSIALSLLVLARGAVCSQMGAPIKTGSR